MTLKLLEIRGIHGGYGGTNILHDVSLEVGEGEIVVIIGPNGAGKSTAMKAVFGLVKINSGSIWLKQKEITGMAANKVVTQRVAFVPQTSNVFPSLTVEENLDMGAYLRKDDTSTTRTRVYDLFPPLIKRKRHPAGQLSGGLRQMVAMGRALMLEPELLLLDEPTAGLSPKYIGQIFEITRDISSLGIGVLMVEQNARQALSIADRGYVLATGKNRYSDSAENLLNNPEIATMFLGG